MKIIQERLWFILVVGIVAAGSATGFTLVATPVYNASTFALVIGLALLAGLVIGLGITLLLEYTARGRRFRERNKRKSSVQEPSNRKSSGS